MTSLEARIRAAYPESKREWDRTYPVIYYLWRPLSFPVSAALMALGATANQVTLATAVLAAAGLAALACPEAAVRAWGSLGLVLYNFLDCVDGNIARASPPERPPKGKFFDQLVGNAYPLSYLFLGLGLRRTDRAWEALAFGAAATAAKFVFLHVRGDFWSVLGPYWGIHKDATSFEGHVGRWYYRLYYNLTDLQGHVLLLPLLLGVGAALPFLAVSAFLAGAELLFFAGLYLRRSFVMRAHGP